MGLLLNMLIREGNMFYVRQETPRFIESQL